MATAYGLDPRAVRTWPLTEIRTWAAAADDIESRRLETLSSLVVLAVHDPQRLIEVTSRVHIDPRTPEEIVASVCKRYGA